MDEENKNIDLSKCKELENQEQKEIEEEKLAIEYSILDVVKALVEEE